MYLGKAKVRKGKMFQVQNIEDLEEVYSILREQYPDQQIDITFNYNTKYYTIQVTNKPFKHDPEVPLDLAIEVVYGDSVTYDTPLLLKNQETNEVHIRCIGELCNSWNEYPELFMFDRVLRLDKYYGHANFLVWSDNGWAKINKVIKHKANKQIYRVVTKTGVVDVTEDHSLVTNKYCLVKPTDVIPNITQLLCSFPSQIHAFSIDDNLINKVVFDDKADAMRAYVFHKTHNKHVVVNVINDLYILDVNDTLEPTNDLGLVEKIVPLGMSTDYVYDIETECGRFHAGVGELIVKNTDSVFLKFKYNKQDFELNRLNTFRLATLCGDKLTQEVFKRPPIEMEFEKVFQPFILLTKKRYIAHKYDNPKDPFQLKGLDAKGIALTRRDYCKMVKSCYKEIIDAIMSNENNGIQDSIQIFKNYITKIDTYKIDIADLEVSAMLAKSYKTKPVHVLLAEKLKARKEEVQIGDRIPYIFIESNDPKKQKSELGEDPQYAKKHGLKYNRTCYLEQLAKPILAFYKIVLKDQPDLLDSLIECVNVKLVSYGAKRLKPSDFKMDE